uniref:Uncharacterized protein n=1 Tax=Paramoeba aestuarina TaxID=180227 RepID=A0A7S4NRU8_9EUKA
MSEMSLPKSKTLSTVGHSIITKALDALLKSVNIDPENDLPHIVKSGDKWTFTPTACQKKRSSYVDLDTFWVEHEGCSFKLAYSSFSQNICVILQDRERRPMEIDEATPGDFSHSNDSTVCGTVLESLLDSFPFAVLYVSSILVGNTNRLDSRLCEIIEETAKIHTNYQKELEVKSMNENELLELIKAGASDLIESQSKIADLSRRIETAGDEISKLRLENVKLADRMSLEELEGSKRRDDENEIMLLNSRLSDAEEQAARLSDDLARTQKECENLQAEKGVLRRESLDHIHTVMDLVATPLQPFPPEGADPNCPSCERLCIACADLKAQLQASEKVRLHVQEEIIHGKSHRMQEICCQRDEIEYLKRKIYELRTEGEETRNKLLACTAQNDELQRTLAQMSSQAQELNRTHPSSVSQHDLMAPTRHYQTFNSFGPGPLGKVAMADDNQLITRKIAHDLETKARLVASKGNFPNAQKKLGQNKADNIDGPLAFMHRLPARHVESPELQSRDLERHIMEIKEKVDRNLQSSSPLLEDEAQMLDVIREELLNSPTSGVVEYDSKIAS